MATYVFGDVQGCYATFARLLERIRFDPNVDRAWMVGDLVNRGPQNLAMLRWLVEHQQCVTAVLGNHDLHLIARHLDIIGPKRRDTLEDVLEAPDRAELVAWLRARPLVHREGKWFLVHAGLVPQWSAEDAEAEARRVEAYLHGDRVRELLTAAWRGKARRWDPSLPEIDRAVVALHAFTQLRVATEDGLPHGIFKGAPDETPKGYRPWFDLSSRRSRDVTVLFGHWAALGLHLSEDAIGLDTGAVWGFALTAIRLEDRAIFQQQRV